MPSSLSLRLCDLIDRHLATPQPDPLRDVPEPLAGLLRGYGFPPEHATRLRRMFDEKAGEIDALEDALADPTSRARLFEFFAAKSLGPTRFAMTALARWVAHLSSHGAITVTAGEAGLDRHGLRFCDTELQFLAPFGNAISPFLERQYFLERDGLRIRPEPGETAMDFGAGTGDTALAFAAALGPGGRVFAIEPTPSERAVQARNLALNPTLAARIVPVDAAVSDTSGQTVSLGGETTHAHISDDAVSGAPHAVTTTIDALVAAQNLNRLDFIKLDIEGMELRALQGAQDSLARFRPKLAVCIYHGWQIFDVVPWMRETLAGYDLHLETHAPIAAETVLYARPRT